MNTSPIHQLLVRLWRHICTRHRWVFGQVLFLMLVASFAEILSVGAVMPFLAVLTAPERVFEHSMAKPIIQGLGLTAPNQLLFPLTIAFGATAFLVGMMRLILLWCSTKLAHGIGADLSINIYRRTLFQTYAVHCARNSSEVINGISAKADGVIFNTLMPILNLLSSSVMLVAILTTLLAVEPVIALLSFGGFGLIYAFIIFFTRKQMKIDSESMARESSNVIKSLQEGLGGIRDVIIDGNQSTYCEIYRKADIPLRRAQGNNLFIGSSPRYGMEALGMILISSLAYMLAQQPDGMAKAIPILGALALGAQRLLPALQQAYAAWMQIYSSQASLQDVLDLLDQPLPDHADRKPMRPLPFEQSISLQQLGFSYSPDTPDVLTNINLEIRKGSCVGFIGATGSGKSTLLDIVMGLLQPTVGSLKIDGRTITSSNTPAWQAHIAHVPQAIFLADSSIEENIAFGIPKDRIDHDKVRKAAQQAHIADSVEMLPKQYQTFVGERGIRLSGGQRQRIGIARALYKQADVIIFDEATSALDYETEQVIMETIDNLSQNLTLLIIAHRLTTLKNCTLIVELGDKGIKRIGSYREIINQAVTTS